MNTAEAVATEPASQPKMVKVQIKFRAVVAPYIQDNPKEVTLEFTAKDLSKEEGETLKRLFPNTRPQVEKLLNTEVVLGSME